MLSFSEALPELFHPSFHVGMDGTGQGRSHYRHCHYDIRVVLGKKLGCKSMLQA